MLKKLAKVALQSTGYELCRYSAAEQQEAARLGWNLGSLNYKEFQVARALATGGHISLDEARFLASLVQQTSPEDPIIEIGTLFGFSTLVLTINKHKEQQLITVDKYVWNPLGISAQAHQLTTRAVLSDACTSQNIVMIQQDKDEFYKNYRGPAPGLFFCDANHSYRPTLDDLMWAQAAGAKIICGHDYDPVHHPDVVRAVKELGGPRELVGSVFVL
jgi:hypothetical protein